jgi:hypothetical protein
MKYEKPAITRCEPAVAVIQSMSKIAPPTPDAAHELTVSAYVADE